MTTPGTTRKLLKKCLEELNEEGLKEFHWYLGQIQINGSRPILKSQLENATRLTTVDKLVEIFDEDGAVERAVDTFFEMQRNDLANKLIKAKADQSREQKEEEPGTSSAREKPRDATTPKDLSCSICLSLFTDPVVLQCGHSFCQTCVHKDWEMNIIRECSHCKQFIPEGDPPINFSLKSLCENYGGRSQGEPSGGHRNNTESFQFQTPPKNIREKQKHDKQLRDSSIERIKTQSFNAENKIMDDFKMFHDLLDEEKMTRRAALREEAKLKIRMIHLISEMTEITYPLSETMAEIDKFGSDERFIVVCATEMKSIQSALRNLQMISQEEINVSKHVENLPLTVLEKIGNKINQTSVVVDPKTASSGPSVSDHQTEVNENDTRQPCPGNPECSTSYQQKLQKSPKRRRVEQDNKNGKVSFNNPDNNTSILTHTKSPVFNFGDEDEVEQGRAETFREDGAQS